MHVRFLIDDNDRMVCGLVDDIFAFLQYRTRAKWRVREEDTNDGEATDDDEAHNRRTTLTVDFTDPFDAIEFHGWRNVGGRGRFV